MTRRGLMRRALWMFVSGAASLTGCVSRVRSPSPTLAAPTNTGPLSRAEMDDLIAFGEILVEGRALADPERRLLGQYIAQRTEQASEQLSRYRLAARTLVLTAGRPFASLGLRERSELVERQGLAGGRLESEDEADPLSRQRRILRRWIVPDLIRGYYRTSAGWAVVGYSAFPGRCGELTRYTRPET